MTVKVKRDCLRRIINERVYEMNNSSKYRVLLLICDNLLIFALDIGLISEKEYQKYIAMIINKEKIY